ncbi:hypothetical protein AAVH_16790 [Aphelenchoides avenae]|nr:hypothetical protein AAVH_16790 [Aphelenchus avenae]
MPCFQKIVNAASAVNPLFVIVLPISGMFLVVVCGVEELNTVVQVCTSFLSWIPVINPLSAIYFIKSYRMELTSLLSGCKNCTWAIRAFSSQSSSDRDSQLARTQKANTTSSRTANATSRSNTVHAAPHFSPLEG